MKDGVSVKFEKTCLFFIPKVVFKLTAVHRIMDGLGVHKVQMIIACLHFGSSHAVKLHSVNINFHLDLSVTLALVLPWFVTI
jgi:hypothetical protein